MLPWTAKVSDGVLVAIPTRPSGATTNLGVVVPTVKSPASVVVPMPMRPSETSTNKLAEVYLSELTVRSPAKVELAETMMPTDEVGLMALGPMNCQLEGVIQEVSFHSELPKASVAVRR